MYYVSSFTGPGHAQVSFISQLDKAVLHLLEFSHDIPGLDSNVAAANPLAVDGLDELSPYVVYFELPLFAHRQSVLTHN